VRKMESMTTQWGRRGKGKRESRLKKMLMIHDSVLSLSLFHRPHSVLDFSLKSLDMREGKYMRFMNKVKLRNVIIALNVKW